MPDGMTILLLTYATTVLLAQGARATATTCQPPTSHVRESGVPELSGLAVSRSLAGRLWTHNDSGQPALFALNTEGAVTGRVQLTGVTFQDWEALATGPCPTGSCVYAGDIGDNAARRESVAVYRFPEPAASQTSVAVKEVYYGRYSDGAHDAEALLVTPDGAIYIVTKGETGPVALYRFPRDLRVGMVHTLERVGKPRDGAKTANTDRITDGTVSANGQWVALRTGRRVTFHRAALFFAGDWTSDRAIDLRTVAEPQGEAVALGAGEVYVAGEAGPKAAAGTFARFACSGIQ